MRASYLDGEHAAKVIAHAQKVQKLKTPRANFLRRAQVKNQVIARHVYERLLDTCGPYDGFAGAENYKSTGEPKLLKWGGPETVFDVHVVAWQLELVQDNIVKREEVLSPGSIALAIKWAITKQPAIDLSRARAIIWWRRPAVQAGWLLTKDAIELEKLNFPHGYKFAAASKEPDIEVDLEI